MTNLTTMNGPPAGVDHAVRAGATWAQIAAVRNTAPEAARAAYREWAEGQHQYAGMGDAEYAAAVEAAGSPQAANRVSGDKGGCQLVRLLDASAVFHCPNLGAEDVEQGHKDLHLVPHVQELQLRDVVLG